MGERADACRRRANDCELAASRVKDQEVCSVYLDMAARWRRMAAQQEAIDRGADRNCPLPTRSAPLIQERLVARRVHPRTVRRRVSRCVQSVRFGPQACFGRIRAWGTLIGSGRTCESSGRRRHLSSEAFRPLAIVPFMRHCAAKLAMLCLTATGRQGASHALAGISKCLQSRRQYWPISAYMQ
jgi:hypothetical protein